jgi:hypothetical protein
VTGELRSFWSSPNFEPPRRRSWPWPATRLEVIAARAGLDDEQLRALLYAEVERRRERCPDGHENGSATGSATGCAFPGTPDTHDPHR